MTSNLELVRLAQQHVDDSAVLALLLSLTDSKVQAEKSLASVQTAAAAYQLAVVSQRVGYDQTPLLTHAAQAVSAMARMNADYAKLARALAELGEDVSR